MKTIFLLFGGVIKARSYDRGFTLVEIIVILAILGIMSAIAVPVLTQAMPRMGVDAAVRQLTSEMLVFKTRAISENRKYRIVFGSPDAGQYYVQQDGNMDGDYKDPQDTIVQTGRLPSGIIFGSNAAKKTTGDKMCSDAICFGSDNGASFKPIGSSDTGSVYLIPAEDLSTKRTDRMRGITINIAGRIKVWRYSGGTKPWRDF